jgi:hypothetical protein
MIEERTEAREYFKSKGLTYLDINRNAINKLMDLVKYELQTYLPSTDHARQMDMRLSCEKKKDFKFKNILGELLYGGIYVDGSYFERREGIYFDDNVFIGFCGWADGENKMPFIIAFKNWCDWLIMQKEKQ